MPLPSTMTPIATNTLSSNTASVTFSNIPQNYTDLVLVTSALHSGSSSSGDIQLTYNSDTASNYSYTDLYGNGSSALSIRSSNATFIKWTYGADALRPMVKAQIMNYSNSTTNKTTLIRDDLASNVTSSRVALWRNTAAITSIKIENPSANFASGSTFTLYGIKAAS